MWPIGHFGKFRDAIVSHYHDYDKITFGILIADPRQSEAREYILNYLNVFNSQSGKVFDFFLPGYDDNPSTYPPLYQPKILINDKTFFFSEEMFNEYLEELREIFGIAYTFNPMLILMSIKPGCLSTAEYIVIELDDNEQHNCRRSGMLFSRIFDIAKSNPDLTHIQIEFGITGLKGNALSFLMKEIAPSWLTEVAKKGKELGRYRIHSIG